MLQLILVVNVMVYVVLCVLQDDVVDDDLCGVCFGCVLLICLEWYVLLFDVLVLILYMVLGDVVFWYGDVVYVVEDVYCGSGDSNVMYIVVVFGCVKNDVYL